MDQPYRFFDHTGDFGVELKAPDAGQALAAFARSFLDLLTDAPATVAEVGEREVELDGMDLADLMVNLGNELIFLFEVEGFLCARLEVEEVEEDYLAAVLHGEVFDPARHPIARPVKAVTHHGACAETTPDGVEARIIYDL